MKPRVNKIDHINVVVTDLQEAQEFFEHFGFTPVASGDLEGKWIETLTGLSDPKATYVALQLPDAQTKLELISYQSPIGSKDDKISALNQIGMRHLAFEVSNIEALVSMAKEKGVHFLSEIQEYKPTNKKLCYFLGPDGIVLELAEYSKK